MVLDPSTLLSHLGRDLNFSNHFGRRSRRIGVPLKALHDMAFKYSNPNRSITNYYHDNSTFVE